MRKREISILHKLRRRASSTRVGYLLWQNSHLPELVVVVIVALFIGVFTGAAAAVVKQLLYLFNTSILEGVNPDSFNIRYLVFPLAGILITSIFQRYVVGASVARGTRIIQTRLQTGRYRFSPYMIFNPLLGCSVTIGFGASAGSEGPTALSGAAIGSVIGRWFGFSRRWIRLLVGIGAGAGISAIFKSPIGGVLFTLEVLSLECSTVPVIALIIACLFSSVTAYVLGDFTFDIEFGRYLQIDPAMLGWVAVLGVFCGLYSIYYNFTKSRSAQWFSSISNPWLAVLVTGGTLSICIFCFPKLFGEGFDMITALINGKPFSFTESGPFASSGAEMWVYISMAAMLLLKGVLVSASYAGGGVAGDFVPTIFAGCLAGFLFATGINDLFGLHLPVWFFALVGMGAVMSGTIHAPLMAIFITAETTNSYAYLLSYLIAAGISYATVKIITPGSWYAETGHDDILELQRRVGETGLKSRIHR